MKILACLFLVATFYNQPTKNKDLIPTENIYWYKLGEKKIAVKIFKYGNEPKIFCVNLHDDETSAVQAAHNLLAEKGGLLIKIENSGKRNISFTLKGLVYNFDPNRIFSTKGISQTLKANGKTNPLATLEVQKFANDFLQLIPDSASCLIALHNNTNGAYSVKSYQKGGYLQEDAKQVITDEWQDVDDICFTTDDVLFAKISTLGYNTILQDNEKVRKDGSLSVYYGERNKRYINIETEHGKTEQYKEMLSKLLSILEEEKTNAAKLTTTKN